MMFGDFAFAYSFNHFIPKAPVQNIRPQFMDVTNSFLQMDNRKNLKEGKPKTKSNSTNITTLSETDRQGTTCPSPSQLFHNSNESQEYEPAPKRQRHNFNAFYD